MAAANTSLPTLSQVQTMDTTYLRDAAAYWTRTANLWENVFTEIHYQMSIPAGTRWHGQAATAALKRSYDDMVKVRGASDQLHEAAATARRGDEQLLACKAGVLDAVRDARAEGFETGDDYSVSDRAKGGSAAFRAARQAKAQGHASFIRHRVAALVAADQQLTTRITAATEGIQSLTFHEPPGAHDGIVGDDKDGRVQPVNHIWKNDPAPTPGPGPNTGPSADDIRRVLDTLPQGDKPWIREVRSPQDLQSLWNWMKQNGAANPNRYPDPGKGDWMDLPDGTGVGQRHAANSTDNPALDVRLPGPNGYVKVHINPQRGGVPEIPAAPRPAAPKAPPPVEPPPVAHPPVEPAPKPAEPAPIPGKGYGSTPLFPNLRIIRPPHSRHGQFHAGDDSEDIREEE
jgi:hypothetical protein